MFLTYIRFDYTSVQQGKLYFFVGTIMFLLQGGLVRRVKVDYANLVCLSVSFYNFYLIIYLTVEQCFFNPRAS